ncbi:MAG: hypothetical protein NC548_53385 [Lachnospiraceae bacterium]|nr:hypothetical protein [Lachnospiraceae bacterium]MCM1235959.1 hypothetical protein [Ruminococcus flavefaciens]
MDSRRIFQFRFVDRYDSKALITNFLNSASGCNTLWLSGIHGTGKTRLISKAMEKCPENGQQPIIYSLGDNSEQDELKQFLELLQQVSPIRFIDFIRTNYTAFVDISKQITTQVLKIAGLDMAGFISAAYDGTKLFINQSKQQHAAAKVIAKYLSVVLDQKPLVVAFDHFSSCKKQSVDLFMQIIGQFVDNADIRFIVCTTDEVMENREDISAKLLTKIPVIPLVLKPFDEDIYFYEILEDVFEIPRKEKSTISQVFSICDGSPIKLQTALIELYRTNVIQLGENKAHIDFQRLKQFILHKEVGFKLENYQIPAQILLRLIIVLNEQAPATLLIDAAKYILKKIFIGFELLATSLPGELSKLYEANIVDIAPLQGITVKISNPIVREALKEQFSKDPIHRLFSSTLVSYFSEQNSFIEALNLSSAWKTRTIVLLSVTGKVSGWIEVALKYGIERYSNGYINDAVEIFSLIQQETEEIASKDLMIIADCFYQIGNYGVAESCLLIINGRNDLRTWGFHFCYSRILNLQLKKEQALQEAKSAVKCAQTAEQRIRALNMQQQILVDTTGGKVEAKEIFLKLVRQLKKEPENSRLILPTLKTAIDFYHGADSFAYMKQAKELSEENDDQLEMAFILTNEGFEYFRQGQVKQAEKQFIKSSKILANIRIHETAYPLNNLANCYMSCGLYENAVSVLLRAALWNQSGYTFVTIQTLLMVCYSFLEMNEKSRQIASNLITYIDSYRITDTTMLRKIYLNIALIYRRLGETDLEGEYAQKAYYVAAHSSSWYRAYQIALPFMQNIADPIKYCPEGEQWYWTNGDYEPWLVTFSHD